MTPEMQVKILQEDIFKIKSILLNRESTDDIEMYIMAVEYDHNNELKVMDYNTILFSISDLFLALTNLVVYKTLQLTEDTIFKMFSLPLNYNNTPITHYNTKIPYETLKYTSHEELLDFLTTNYPELYY